MNKQKYYISVQSGSILSNQGDAPYEFEVEAAPKEIAQLRELFDFQSAADTDGLIRGPIPGIPYHHDEVNDVYDEQLQSIYQMLYELGTPETRQHIEEMGLTKIQGTK